MKKMCKTYFLSSFINKLDVSNICRINQSGINGLNLIELNANYNCNSKV